MTSRVLNRAVTNKNDYVTCIARYLSCVSSAQSSFKGVQWKYIARLVEFSSNVVLKQRLTTKKSGKILIRLLKPATLCVDQSERTFIVSGSEIWTVRIFRRVNQMEDSGIYLALWGAFYRFKIWGLFKRLWSFFAPREIYSHLYFLGSLSQLPFYMCPHTNPQIARKKVFLECLLKMLSSLFLLENLLNFISITFRNVKWSWKKAILNSFAIIQSNQSINQSLFLLI